MTTRLTICMLAAILPAAGQWRNIPADGAPKNADGTPNLNAPAPRTAGGKVDLSGIWVPQGTKFLANIAADLGAENVPLRPEAKALHASRAGGAMGHLEPDANCLPQGVPKIDAAPVPWKLIQTPNLVVIIYEAFNLWRQVFLDSRELIADPNPSWLGWSKGHWEGNDTLVVETRGFNGKAWLDSTGYPASDALKVTEKFRRPTFGQLEIEITIDDPKMYTAPWTVKETPRLGLNTELFEFICLENERDLVHMNK